MENNQLTALSYPFWHENCPFYLTVSQSTEFRNWNGGIRIYGI